MLATRLPRHKACQLLARTSVLPRPSTWRPFTRAFHASAPRKDLLADAILYLPHEMISLIHTTVPWYAAIPLSAFVVRGLLVTTAGAYARSLLARYIGLQPLRQALASQKKDETMRRGNFRTPKEAILTVNKEIRALTSALDKRWNTTLAGQISWTIAQIPIFLVMAETVRQKCGAHDGLLGMASSTIEGQSMKMENESGELVARVTPSAWFDPSLATEGMLWFPDLLIPDPTGVLPFIASALMFSNIYRTKNVPPSDSKWPNLVRRTLLLVALSVGPCCQHVPAALMLYWCSSTTSVILWNVWLDWAYPAPRGYTACKRPLVMPPAPAPAQATKRRKIF
ncbi:COX18 required for activity of mitochondrial cytochrome oxidase [Pyrenophora seminiperda CCB06]|uniref:COX18 required for activity of mitochondrial cytochrome oxidase n=1 Tax=Pyrenophora seminiperda CCB06 TaxID=1302712 RepID=A0A3M7M4W3_9PLEO|nr:COX18 required for activity of mitochondrial cytochrome oxidase [Pyrenophora seminiperda CCB06]